MRRGITESGDHHDPSFGPAREILRVRNTSRIRISFELDFTNEYLKAFLGADFGTLGGYFASFSRPVYLTRGGWVGEWVGLACRSQWDGKQAE